jgi:hypothetical protein
MLNFQMYMLYISGVSAINPDFYVILFFSSNYIFRIVMSATIYVKNDVLFFFMPDLITTWVVEK